MRGNGVDLRSPGDIAQLTRASAVHRLRLPSGEPATGLGIVVGMLDFGFAPHPFYDDHGYRITRLSAPCANDPEVDPIGHGTGILATLLACAPDAHVLAIKMGPNNVAAIAMAAQHANTKVLSLSFSTDDHRSGRPLSDHEIAVWIEILNAVSRGIVVVSAGGNFGRESLPALLTDVIAVGGLEIDQVDRLTRWPESSYFVNPINPGRRVPDVCAMASTMTLPAPEQAWVIRVGATSAAAPQVAGVAALLLQRCPGLTPDAVRAAIVAGARAVDDTGTGAGLVSALGAWRYLDAHPPD
jgi:subtilisin family serine protease